MRPAQIAVPFLALALGASEASAGFGRLWGGASKPAATATPRPLKKLGLAVLAGLAAHTLVPSPAAAAPIPAPNVFGSVALPLGKPSEKFEAVSTAPQPTSQRWRTAVRQASRLTGEQRLAAVNLSVNRAITYRSDLAERGVYDHWATPRQTYARGRGDCEDFVVAKMKMLEAAGIPRRQQYMVIVKDVVARQDHAVLVVRTGGRSYMLDNFHDRVLPVENVRDLKPIVSYSAGTSWLHGFPAQPG